MNELTKQDIIDYLAEELKDARKSWLASQGNGEKARELASDRYSYIFMICNDLGIS